MLLGIISIQAQVFITEIADPDNESGARFVELYNAGSVAVDLSTGWQINRYTNNNATPQTAVDLTGTIPAGGFYIICNNATTFNSTYGFDADQDIGTSGPADSNGDDQIFLLSPGAIVVDFFGVVGEDGSNTCHDFEDGRAERIASVTAGNSTWDESEWNVWSDASTASGCTNHISDAPQTAPNDFDPGEWIGATSGPTKLAFQTQPSDVAVNATMSSFTVAATDDAGTTDDTYTGTVTINSNGNMTGTLSKDAVSGIATFDDISFDAAGTYTISASATDLTYTVSASFNVTTADALDWNNLQYPESGTITVGDAYNVYAQAYENGVTDASGQGAGVTCWIGINDANTDPSTWSTYNWTTTAYNTDSGNNDEYMAEIGSVLPAGTYYYASRFQLNSGGYTYGGYNASGGGFWDGTTNVSGVLTVNPLPATKLAFQVQPSNVQVNTVMTPAVTVAATDANDNTVTTYTSTVTLTFNGTGNMAGTYTQTAVAGIATFDDLTFDTEGTSYTITANSGTLTYTTSATFDVTAVPTGGMEDFTNFSETGSSYHDGTFTGNDGSTWTYTQCRGDQDINAPTPTLAKNSTANILSGTISGGCGILSFDYMQVFSTSVELEVYVNNTLVKTVTTSKAGGVINTGDITVNQSGDFTLKFMQANSDAGQVAIDNINWTGATASTDPTIAITAPTTGTTVYTSTVPVVCDVQNFTVAPASAGDGYISYNINGGTYTSTYSQTFTLSDLSLGTYTLTTKLVDNSGVDITPAAVYTVTFTVAETPATPEVVISEIACKGYGADFNDEYIELINSGSSSQSLDGLTLEYYEGTNIEKSITFGSTDEIAANDAFVVAVRTSHTSAINADYTPTSGFNINNPCYVVLKDASDAIIDQAGSATDLFDEANNYEFTNCGGDNSLVANWDNLGNENGTPGAVNCGSTDPSITIVTPVDGSTVSTSTVTVLCTVQNFTMGTDGYITYDYDGTTYSSTTTTFDITGLASDIYTLTTNLVDNTGAALDPAATYTVTFTVDLTSGPTEVANIAALRAGATDGTEYTLTGEAIITFQEAYRGHKFIEDATAAILIDDNDGVITTTYNRYDGITGITGTLSVHEGMLQFVPTTNTAAASSTGNTITPQVITASEFTTNFEDYEAELVTIDDVTFTDADGTATFATGTVYEMTDNSKGTANFRTNFYDADYIDGVIPENANITGFGIEKDPEGFTFTARDLADFEVLSTDDPTLTITSPTTGDVITVNSADVTFNVTNFVLGTDGEVQYSIDGGTTTATTQTSPISFTDLADNDYTVDLELVDMSGASLTTPVTATVDFTINTTGSISDVQNIVTIYPNPTTDVIFFEGNVQSVKLFDVLGAQMNVMFDNNKMDINTLSQGVYVAQITLNNGEIVTQRIIKK